MVQEWLKYQNAWLVGKGHNKQTKAHFSKKDASIRQKVYNDDCGCSCPILIPVTETDWKLEPMLAGKGPSGPDRFDILGYQALHIHFRPAVMDPQEIPAGFESFRKVRLVFIFSSPTVNRHPGYNGGTEVVQDGTRPYFLDNILIFFGVECLQA